MNTTQDPTVTIRFPTTPGVTIDSRRIGATVEAVVRALSDLENRSESEDSQ